MIHSLIFQLAIDDEQLRKVLCQSSRENLRSNTTVAKELLRELLQCAGPVSIVIDGLDEIDAIERRGLLKSVIEITASCDEARLLISSRIEDDISRILQSACSSIRVDTRNTGSIEAFVSHWQEEWFQRREFPDDDQLEISELLKPLPAKANGSYIILYIQDGLTLTRLGMFLYARIVLHCIDLSCDTEEIRQQLEELPTGLDEA